MRKVERNMIDAIERGRDWREGNTEVFWIDADRRYAHVLLHGNVIAHVHAPHGYAGLYRVRPVPETFRLWPTATTASRLRALGIQASAGARRSATIDGVPV